MHKVDYLYNTNTHAQAILSQLNSAYWYSNQRALLLSSMAERTSSRVQLVMFVSHVSIGELW